MKRMAKTILFGFLITSLFSGFAWAGTAHVNHGALNTAVQIATETLSTSRNCAINTNAVPTGANYRGGLIYIPTQNLTSGNLVRVTLTNASFMPGTVYVLGFNAGNAGNVGASRIGQAIIPAGGANNVYFQLNIAANFSIQAGGTNYILFTNEASTTDINAAGTNAGAGALNMTFTTGATSGSATAAIDIATSGGIVVDASGTAAIAQVGRERTPSLTTNNVAIDYVNSPFDGKLFSAASSAVVARNMATNNAIGFNVAYAAKDVGIALGANNAGLTSNIVVNFDSSNEWQGVTRMWIGGTGADCLIGNNVSNVVSSPSGAVALNVSSTAAAGYNQALAANFGPRICIETAGNVELKPRSISGNVAINVVGGTTFPALAGVFQNWFPNGFTAYIPQMRYGETTRGFIRLVNNGTRDAQMKASILKSDGTVINDIDLGTIAIGQIVNLSAQTIGLAQGLGAEANYAMQITASTSPDAIYANAFFNLLSGGVWTTRDNTLYENWKNFIGNK